MELSKCMGCMEQYAGDPCPKCGFSPQTYKAPEYVLAPESILAGKYLVGRMLGQGSFGITYIGLDIAQERKVAIKEYYPSGQVIRAPGTLKLSWYTSEQSVQARNDGMQMFLKEARKMARVDRVPGVVRVHDLFQENGTAYIVMDYVEGETLKARLRRDGSMTWEQAQIIFRQAVFAMAAVHKAGLVHRDLSPDNLMLVPGGNVKILDLGAAKDLKINSGASSMQVAKSGFSPWEQYTQRGSSGPWTDVYAMAATIYYSLTGKIPPSAMERIENDMISWDLPQLRVLPRNVVTALQKAMKVRVSDRTQSMEDLASGLFAAAEERKSWADAYTPPSAAARPAGTQAAPPTVGKTPSVDRAAVRYQPSTSASAARPLSVSASSGSTAAAAATSGESMLYRAILGAFLGSLVGVVAQFIFVNVEMVSAFAGIAAYFCASYCFLRFAKGDANALRWRVLTCSVVTAVMIAVGAVLAYAWVVMKAYKELNVPLSIFEAADMMFNDRDFSSVEDSLIEYICLSYAFWGMYVGVQKLREKSTARKAAKK